MACKSKIPEIIACPLLFKYLRMQGAKSIKGGFKILANIRSKGALDLFAYPQNPLLENKQYGFPIC